MFNPIKKLTIFCALMFSPAAAKDSPITQEVNHQRLCHSNLHVSPKTLQQQRHAFALERLRRDSAKTTPAQAEKRVVHLDNAPLQPTVSKIPPPAIVRPMPSLTAEKRFDWTMIPPVKAAISHKFGEGEKKLSQGIIYTVRSDQMVMAPVGGEIIFAGTLSGFGHVVMIEKNFESIILVAGMKGLNIKQGDTVCRGQTIGSVVKGNWVYLEFRHEGSPINPEQLLATSG